MRNDTVSAAPKSGVEPQPGVVAVADDADAVDATLETPARPPPPRAAAAARARAAGGGGAARGAAAAAVGARGRGARGRARGLALFELGLGARAARWSSVARARVGGDARARDAVARGEGGLDREVRERESARLATSTQHELRLGLLPLRMAAARRRAPRREVAPEPLVRAGRGRAVARGERRGRAATRACCARASPLALGRQPPLPSCASRAHLREAGRRGDFRA